MSSVQTTSTPINGEEARKIIEQQFDHLLEHTPGLDFASAYHKFTVKGEFEIGAYPADTPTPRKEIEFDVNSIATTRKENEEVLEYTKRLNTIREELLFRLQEVNDLLDVYNPITRVEFDLTTDDNGESKPDKLRIEQGLPIPVVTKAGGRNVEVYRDVQKRTDGGFQFGKGRSNT